MVVFEMIKRNKIIESGIGYTIGNFLVKGVVFLSIPIFTRLMNPAEFGQFSIFMSYSSILVIFLGLCLQNTIKNAFYEFRGELENYIKNIILLNITLLFLFLFILSIGRKIITFAIGFDFIILVMMLMEAFSLSIISIYNIYLTISYEYKKFIYISGMNGFLSIVLSLYFIYNGIFSQSYVSRIFGTVIPALAISFYLIYFFWSKEKYYFKYAYFHFALSFSVPLVIHGLSTIVLGQIDTLMLQRFIGNKATGLFTFALTFNTIFLIISNSLNNSWGSWVFEKLDKKDYTQIQQKSRVYFLLMLLICTCVMLFIPELTILLSTREYIDSIWMSIPLTLSSYFAFLYSSVIHVEYFYKKTSYIALSSCGAAIVNFLLAYLLIPHIGKFVAAYIHLLSYISYFLFHLICVQKTVKVFNVKITLLYSGLGIAMMFISLFLVNYLCIRILVLILLLTYIFYKIKLKRKDVFSYERI